MNKNLKKVTMKDRYGNSVSFEMHNLMQGITDAQVPPMQDIPVYDHPGDPRGTDTVPAWLTPGEFVMNAEATRMYEPQIKAMNEHGRAVQRQQGGTIPEIPEEEERFLNIEGSGGTNEYGTGYGGRATLNIPLTDNITVSPYISGGGFKPNNGPHQGSIGQYGIGASYRFNQGGTVYAADGKMITGDDFQRYADAVRYAENNLSHYDDEGSVARSPDNAIGMMQVVPTTAARPGISTDVFKVADSMGIPYDKEAYAQELAARQVKGADVPPMAMAEAERLLQNPAVNIRMGDEYLYKMGQRNNGDLELAAAGYNAGPGGASKYSAAREAGDFSMLPERMQKETVPYVDKVMNQYSPGIASDMAAGFRIPTGGDEYSDIGADPFEVKPLSSEDAITGLGESRMPLIGNETTSTNILRERAEANVPEILPVPEKLAMEQQLDAELAGAMPPPKPVNPRSGRQTSEGVPQPTTGLIANSKEIGERREAVDAIDTLEELGTLTPEQADNKREEALKPKVADSTEPSGHRARIEEQVRNRLHNERIASADKLLEKGLISKEQHAKAIEEANNIFNKGASEKVPDRPDVVSAKDQTDVFAPESKNASSSTPINYEQFKQQAINDITAPEGMRKLTNQEWWNRTKEGTVGLTSETMFAAAETAQNNPTWFDKIVDKLAEGFSNAMGDAIPAAIESGLMYTASRLLGYNDYDSTAFANKIMKQRMEENRKGRISANLKRQEKALELYGDNKIGASEYAALVKGDISLVQALSGTSNDGSVLSVKRYGERNHGIDFDKPKDTIYSVGPLAGKTVSVYTGLDGKYIIDKDKDGKNNLFKIPAGMEPYSNDFHALPEIAKAIKFNLSEATKDDYIDQTITSKDGDEKVTQKVRIRPVNVNKLVDTAVLYHKNKNMPHSIIKFNNPAGSAMLQNYYDAVKAYRLKAVAANPKIKEEELESNYAGIIAAVDAGIKKNNGEIVVKPFDKHSSKALKPISAELARLYGNNARDKGVELAKVATTVWTQDISALNKEDPVRKLLEKYRGKDAPVPAGSSALAEFTAQYLALQK
jgi:hypothetical protein